MLFTLETLRAKHGDAFLLHYGASDDPQLAVIDGGPGRVWEETLRPRLQALRQARVGDERLSIPLLMVSHIDDDHINGLLDLTKELVDDKNAGRVLDFKVGDVWHNSFDDILGNERSTGVLTASTAGVQSASVAAGVIPGVDADSGAVVASVRQGRQLRLDCEALGIPTNRPFGDFVRAEPAAQQITLDNVRWTVAGPTLQRLQKLREKWDQELRRLGLGIQPSQAFAAEYVDKSVFNLASIVVLVEADDAAGVPHSMLLCGDARGDDILDGLQTVDRLDAAGKMHVDLFKLPHHGSDRNVTRELFTKITAENYVVSGDGRHHNPEVETFRMLLDARGNDRFTIHMTYGIDELGHGYPQQDLRDLLATRKAAGAQFEIEAASPGAAISLDLLDPLG